MEIKNQSLEEKAKLILETKKIGDKISNEELNILHSYYESVEDYKGLFKIHALSMAEFGFLHFGNYAPMFVVSDLIWMSAAADKLDHKSDAKLLLQTAELFFENSPGLGEYTDMLKVEILNQKCILGMASEEEYTEFTEIKNKIEKIDGRTIEKV